MGKNSIDRIRQTVEEARQLLLKHTARDIAKKETQLKKLTYSLQQSRQQNDFIEFDVNEWKEEVTQLVEKLAKPSHIDVRQDLIPLVTNKRFTLTSLASSLVIPE